MRRHAHAMPTRQTGAPFMKIFGSIQRLITLVFQYGAYTHTVQPDSAASASSVLTLPKTTDTIVGRVQLEELGNKTLLTASTQIADSSTNPKAIKFATAGATASTATTLVAAQTGNISINLPIVASTLSTLAGTETITNKVLTGGTADATHKYSPPQETTTNLNALASRTEGEIAYDTTAKQLKTYNGTNWIAGSGDVAGPAASVDNAIVRFSGTTGKLIQDYTSGAPTISDTGVIDPVAGFGTTTNGAASATASGLVTTAAQTIGGVKTFGSNPVIGGLTAASTAGILLPGRTDGSLHATGYIG